MLPNAFVQLENWPLLSNGKINRKLLPDPERNDLLSKNYTAPRDAVEQQIASVWKELLQLNDIGINDNFFELGGHSLLATIALTRLQNEFNVKIPLTAFFNEPTIANFATAIHEARQTQSDDSEEITL
jgi:tyrocidine synthetase-3